MEGFKMIRAAEAKKISQETLEKVLEHIISSQALLGQQHACFLNNDFCVLSDAEKILRENGYVTKISSNTISIDW